ncbi:hypothetical protein [Antarctobacter sp.]|uniref:hypothetical protein n=1 Tax=Antarctobacter sp. TaxID=1872577 RepID=UPI003A8CA33B
MRKLLSMAGCNFRSRTVLPEARKRARQNSICHAQFLCRGNPHFAHHIKPLGLIHLLGQLGKKLIHFAVIPFRIMSPTVAKAVLAEHSVRISPAHRAVTGRNGAIAGGEAFTRVCTFLRGDLCALVGILLAPDHRVQRAAATAPQCELVRH